MIKFNKIVIYLDIDGVLATSHQFGSKKRHEKYNCYPFDKKCVIVLNKILLKYNPSIVLSSDWKQHYTLKEMNEIFEWNGVKGKIIDVTPNLWKREYSFTLLNKNRADEILSHVKKHKINNYIVIDDLSMFKWLGDNFIHTPCVNEGIKQSGVGDKIINKLNEML